jgi:hypothetical protein
VATLTEQVAELAAKVEQLETTLAAGHSASQAASVAAGDQGDGRYFAGLIQFVNLWLLPTFRRPLSALGMGDWHWCPRWSEHPEAWMTFGALWDEWETNRTEQLGMIEFTRDVLEMLPTICGADGPFTRCRMATRENGFEVRRHEQLPMAPVVAAPSGWWEGWWQSDDDQPDGQAPQLRFPGLEEFVCGLLLPTFRRDLHSVGMRRWNWCDAWWRHDEVVHHFMNLWYLFEARVGERRLVEFVREVYFLWPHLHGDDGPMRECTPTGTPSGPRHADLTIAPVHDRATSVAGDGWLKLLAPTPQRRAPDAGLDSGETTPGPQLHLTERGASAGSRLQTGQ